MAVYNDERFIQESIDSVLSQTLQDFEFIIVNDASTDKSAEIIKNNGIKDSRIFLIENAENLGLAASLNKGLDKAQGKYIARMDGDDICEPYRFEQQLRFFEKDHTLVLVGSNVRQINQEGYKMMQTSLPLTDSAIRSHCILLNPFAHPSVMMSAHPFQENGLRYNEEFDTTQDWELWGRLLEYGKGLNIAEPLVRQRFHSHSISAVKQDRQLQNTLKIQESYISRHFHHDLWDEELFTNIRFSIFGNKSLVQQHNVDVKKVCTSLLGLVDNLKKNYPHYELEVFERLVVWRVFRTMMRFPNLFLSIAGRLLQNHAMASLSIPLQGVKALFQRLL
ncbi:glycosyltransferase family 2 protein [Candidatus Terasakiella magnetica]|nr:glycosyltransferase family 2 protein [Candidatus Terasakiella magnetica]